MVDFFILRGIFPGGLDGIGMKRNSLRLHDLADLFDRKDHPGFIIGIHDRDEGRLIGDRLLQLIQIEPSLPIDRKFGDPVAFSA